MVILIHSDLIFFKSIVAPDFTLSAIKLNSLIAYNTLCVPICDNYQDL